MSKKKGKFEGDLYSNEELEEGIRFLDEEEDDYYLDDEIDENDEDYWLDDEEEEQPEEDTEKVGDGSDPDGEEEEYEEPEESDESYEDKEESEDAFYGDEEESEDAFYEEEEEYADEFYEEEEESENTSGEEIEKSAKNMSRKKKRKAKKKKKSMKKTAVIAGSVVGVLAVVYIGISVFFMSHFYINTEINGQKFSGKTAADVERYMKEQVQDYTLTILEKDNKTDSISGEEIDLVYQENDEIQDALKKQNAFLWPAAFFGKNAAKVTIDVSYDETKLETQISSLQAVQAEQIPATSAYPKYDGEKFVVEPEVTGTAVDMDALREKINQYISEFQSELDMEKEKCYAMPKYTSESPEVQAACDEMNQYLQASITYTMDENVVVDKELISTWVTADAELNVTFNEEAVRSWLTEFGNKYDTVGTTRTITTPWGKTTEVSGGTYGWGIDEDTEFTALTNSIKNGEVVTKEPAYYEGQVAASHGPQDWGSTYAEVDISAQHMWYIVDGAVALETDVVTGKPTPDMETPAGVYNILEKESPSILVGEDDPVTGKPIYETEVTFWIRITWSGIGFHDATWQPAFGGTLYSDGLGSHGCVNMPYSMAGSLYDMISVGTPVIIHY